MKSQLSQILSVLQRVGQSLMIPVSVLPAAGLLIALGRVFPENHLAHALLVQGGLSVFKQLSLLFAIGVAIGFTSGAGVAGLAAAVGFFLLQTLLEVASQFLSVGQETAIKIDTGVFGGILVGLVAAACFHRFHEAKLPQALGFFSGKRLVPIMTAVMTIFLAGLLTLMWPPVQDGIREFGHWVTNSQFGPAFYAAGKRLLIPVGLHHVYYPSFLYEFGEFVKASGDIVRGETARYYAGDPQAGRFMASEFPIMLFGLPAAALAIVLRAHKSRRTVIAGVMLSAALTSILTGITEPIEFSFIFVAPVLFVVHVVLAFCSGLLTNFFEIQLGYTFSASLIDFVTGFFNQKNSLSLWLIVGPLMALAYFSSFYTLIGWLKLVTPGRETRNEDEPVTPLVSAKLSPQNKEQILKIASALGGPENWLQVEACITRLRMKVKDPTLINESQLRQLGAVGIMKAGQNVQVVFGTQSDSIREALLKIEKSQSPFTSPMSGKFIPLADVPDATFSQKILGDGFAINPDGHEVRSPFNGQVTSLISTFHAIGLTNEKGFETLIHVGIDTVKLKGQGFQAHVKEGDTVKQGQLLLSFDPQLIKEKGYSLVTPIIFTAAEGWKWKLTNKINIQAGDAMLDELRNH
jgi:glucose-specific phosphotransferase system IIA component